MNAPLVAVLLRASTEELDAWRRDPSSLLDVALAQAIGEGRALDLGTRWSELGCLLEGGISTPRSGPTVGDEPLAAGTEEAAWASVSPERVEAIAAEFAAISRASFLERYTVDDGDTVDSLPDEGSKVDDLAVHLYRRFSQLRAHYADAAARGEAMIVRIGARTW